MTAQNKSITVATVDSVEVINKLKVISNQVQSLPSITSDDDYDLAYEIRSKIKTAIKFIHSKTKPNIKRWNDGHKASLAEERELVKPFNDLDSQLDSMMLDWNKRKKEIESKLKLEREEELLEISKSLLSEDLENVVENNSYDITSESQVQGIMLSSLLPAYVPEKPRGERVYKKIKIVDVSKFNSNFITFLLSDPDIQETVCTWLKKQSKLLGGFEVLLDLAGKGSIEEISEETISIR